MSKLSILAIKCQNSLNIYKQLKRKQSMVPILGTNICLWLCTREGKTACLLLQKQLENLRSKNAHRITSLCKIMHQITLCSCAIRSENQIWNKISNIIQSKKHYKQEPVKRKNSDLCIFVTLINKLHIYFFKGRTFGL